MRHRHDIVLQPVMRHQQPTGASLLDRVEPIARGGLCAEIEQRVVEPHQDGADSGALIEGCLTFGGVHSQCATGYLDKSPAGSTPPRREGRPFRRRPRSRSSHFDRSGVRHFRQNRDDPFFDEIGAAAGTSTKER
jgi:hypothetical protein